jgi:hypothetical protein
VLRATWRLLRPVGRTAFYTIHPAPGLTPWQRRRAHRDGPVAVATSPPYPELMERAGFIDITEADCTPEFVDVARAWIEQWDEHRSELERQLGPAAFAERQAERHIQLRAVEDGLLRRCLLIASRPAG